MAKSVMEGIVSVVQELQSKSDLGDDSIVTDFGMFR